MRPRHILLLRTLVMLSLLGLAGPGAVAKPWWMRGIDSNETDFLPPDVAFRVGARIDGSALRVRWVIADGYYLYRQKIAVAAESPDLVVSGISLPQGRREDRSLSRHPGDLQPAGRRHRGLPAARRRSPPPADQSDLPRLRGGGPCYPPITKVLSPTAPAPPAAETSPRWEGYAILGGAFAFLLAGLVLRKGRNLPLPAA